MEDIEKKRKKIEVLPIRVPKSNLFIVTFLFKVTEVVIKSKKSK